MKALLLDTDLKYSNHDDKIQYDRIMSALLRNYVDIRMISLANFWTHYGMGFRTDFDKFGSSPGNTAKTALEHIVEIEKPELVIIGDAVGKAAKIDAVKAVNKRADSLFMDLGLYLCSCGEEKCGTKEWLESLTKQRALNNYFINGDTEHNNFVIEGILKNQFRR